MRFVLWALLAYPLLLFSQGFNELIVLAGTESPRQSVLYRVMEANIHEEAAPILLHYSLLKRILAEPVRTPLSEQPTNFPKDWHVFQHAGTTNKLLLLIPQKYLGRRKAELPATHDIETLVFECGFNTKHLKRITDNSPKNLIAALQAIAPEPSEFNFATALKEILLSVKKSKPATAAEEKIAAQAKAEEMPWLFYWLGHGAPPKTLRPRTLPHKIPSAEGAVRNAVLYLNLQDDLIKGLVARKDSLLPVLQTSDRHKIMDATSKFSANFEDPFYYAAQIFAQLESQLPELEEIRQNKSQTSLALEKSPQDSNLKAKFTALQKEETDLNERINDQLAENSKLLNGSLETALRKLNEERANMVSTLDKAQQELKMALAQQSTMLPATALVGGIPKDDFLESIKFLNTNLNVSFLAYVSCFSGGVNQQFVQDSLKHLQANFLVATFGVGEKSVSVGLNNFNFNDYFSLLRSYFSPKKLAQRPAKKKSDQTDPLVTILKCVMNPGY